IYLYTTFYSLTNKMLSSSVYTLDLTAGSVSETDLPSVPGSAASAIQNNKLYLIGYNPTSRMMSVSGFYGVSQVYSRVLPLGGVDINTTNHYNKDDHEKLLNVLHEAFSDLELVHFDQTSGHHPATSLANHQLYITENGLVISTRVDNVDNQKLLAINTRFPGIYLLNLPFDKEEPAGLHVIGGSKDTRFSSTFFDDKLFVALAQRHRIELLSYSFPEMDEVTIDNITESTILKDSYVEHEATNRKEEKKAKRMLRLVYYGDPGLAIHDFSEDKYLLDLVAYDVRSVTAAVNSTAIPITFTVVYEVIVSIDKQKLRPSENTLTKEDYRQTVKVKEFRKHKDAVFIEADQYQYVLLPSEDNEGYTIRIIE
ncbi:MAG: hypothetical protein WBH03_22970, partial [Cyclobacteriaceae bacterium]